MGGERSERERERKEEERKRKRLVANGGRERRKQNSSLPPRLFTHLAGRLFLQQGEQPEAAAVEAVGLGSPRKRHREKERKEREKRERGKKTTRS